MTSLIILIISYVIFYKFLTNKLLKDKKTLKSMRSLILFMMPFNILIMKIQPQNWILMIGEEFGKI